MEPRTFVIEPDPARQRLITGAIGDLKSIVLAGTAQAPSAEQIVASKPDLVLVDSGLIYDDSIQEALVRTSRLLPRAQFVLIGSGADLEALLRASIVLPLRGFLSIQHISVPEFEQTLLTIAAGGAVIEPASARQLLSYLRHASVIARRRLDVSRSLSERELEIMKLVGEGLSNKEIAFRMGIGLGTVRTHLRNVFRKLGVATRDGAARLTFPAAGSTTPHSQAS
jgi:DNA-binding NarL/FixJ family response regulator